ncbi:MAG: insulinase family protein [Candidatus Eisenbacteria bacterium]|nr:insulinase family protein [Candidatus Eisenbacteria bacterium]
MSSTVQKTRLPSGITLLTQPMPDRMTVALGVWVRSGSRAENDGLQGMAHFIEHMMFKGTESRDARTIAASLESLGGHLDAWTNHEHVCYEARALSEHLPQVVDVLADITCRSRFDAVELEREKSVVKQEIAACEDDPSDKIHELLARQIWGTHGLGRPILGTVESVDGFTRDSLHANFASRYRAEELVIAAAGGLDPAELASLIERHFAAPSGPALVRDPSPAPGRPTVQHDDRDEQQLYLALGTPTPAYCDPRRYALRVLNTLLGGLMSSRLFQRIREEAGLAYSIGSGMSFLSDAGLLSIQMGVAPEQGREALRLLRQELDRLVAEGPDESEVEAAKMYLKGGVIIGLESVSNRMEHMARQELYTGRYTPPEEHVRAVLAVTRDDVAALAAEFLRPERYSLSVLGPTSEGAITEADWPVQG